MMWESADKSRKHCYRKIVTAIGPQMRKNMERPVVSSALSELFSGIHESVFLMEMEESKGAPHYEELFMISHILSLSQNRCVLVC